MTLYRETPCEHGAIGTHDLWTQDTGRGKGCSGGSYEEVPMWEQFQSVMGQDDDGTPNGKDYIESRYVSNWVIVEKETAST